MYILLHSSNMCELLNIFTCIAWIFQNEVKGFWVKGSFKWDYVVNVVMIEMIYCVYMV